MKQIPRIVPSETTEIIKHQPQPFEASSSAKTEANTSITASQHRHFCIPPPEDVKHFFDTVSSCYADEIDAHMNIFDAFNGEEYLKMMNWSIKSICEIVNEDVYFASSEALSS